MGIFSRIRISPLIIKGLRDDDIKSYTLPSGIFVVVMEADIYFVSKNLCHYDAWVFADTACEARRAPRFGCYGAPPNYHVFP